ncbi:MAG: hypothetical protein JEZ09_15770 [Salinivirgaceae bacterium]|nr:hypothetical protein [Salinivirgaceae bacterium]
MEFSLKDYNSLNSKNIDLFPRNFFPYIPLDRKNYNALENNHKESGLKITDAFRELKKRTGKNYFNKVYPAQSTALSFSEKSFPAYRFLLPEVLVDDWLSIVDFHKKHSRDHALHQPLTAYIVYKLLGGGISKKSLKIGDKYLLDLCVDQIFSSPKTNYLKEYVLNLGANSSDVLDLLLDNTISREFWKSLFFETAIVSAIFHDVGYPWQYINRLNHSLSSSDFSPNNLASNSKFVYETFQDRLILFPFNGYNSLTKNTPSNWNEKLLNLISSSLSKTHGFPGALGFLYLNDITREFPTKKKLPFHHFCVDWAALGIMMHDLGKIYVGDSSCPPENGQMRLEFDRDPLSCIITLADLLEEFERPNVDFDVYTESSKYKYDFACLSSKVTFANNILKIEYKYKDRNGVANKLPFIAKEEKEFFDSDYGYLDFSSIGIDKVKMYARGK